MSQTTSPLDQHRTEVEGWVAEKLSYRQIIENLAALGIPSSERSIRRALDRWGVARPAGQGKLFDDSGFTVEQDEATVTERPTFAYSHPDDLLKERGLDPEDWEVKSFTVNEWDSPTGDVLKQLKAQCVRKKPFSVVLPADIDLKVPAPVEPDKGKVRFVVLVGDQQAPFHDTHLHELFCGWLAENQPDEGILVGDSGDFNTISRHPDEPDWKADTQECVTSTGQIFYDYRVAHTPTKWKKIPGNHDERLRRVVIDRLADWYGLKPAEVPNLPELPPIHHPRHLLRLDELGIEYVEPRGSYDHAQVKLSPYLAVRHGWVARKGAGASALATLDQLGYSVAVGHTHRQSVVHQTKHDINGKPETRTAVETGCMCRIENGLGYAVAPDWQNGFATATIWPDGMFKLELATYVNGVLMYRDQRYS